MLIDTGEILKFAEECPGGESFWVDFEGKSHSADMGYAIEFLEQFHEYANTVPRGEFYKKMTELFERVQNERRKA